MKSMPPVITNGEFVQYYCSLKEILSHFIQKSALFLLFGTLIGCSSRHDESFVLAPDLILVEGHKEERTPIVVIADSGGTAVIPTSHRWHGVMSQKLVYKGREIFASKQREDKYVMSPNKKLVLVVSWLHDKPFVILNPEKSTQLFIKDPGTIADHDFVYPFQFNRWSEDSSAILAYVGGIFVSDTQQLMAYREYWRIDANTGELKMEKRLTQRWNTNLTWSAGDAID